MIEESSPKPKLYHSIREVSELLEVKPHVLRYWETQFRSLKPKKNRAGNRMYRDHDLDLLRTIKELLYDRRYTIAGARRKLQEEHREPVPESDPQTELEFLSPSRRQQLRSIRNELVALRNWLASDRRS